MGKTENKQFKILFVCQGNICRSPLAEGVLNHLAAQGGIADKLHSESAGTSGYHVSEPPDRRMQGVAERRGIQLTGGSRQFDLEDFKRFDLILAMDRQNYSDIIHYGKNFDSRAHIDLFLNYDEQSSEGASVPDPYYGGDRGFEHVYELVERTCKRLVHLFTEDTLLPDSR